MLPRVLVNLGGRTRLVCEVARTAAEQARGLQEHAPLYDGEGMLFPFSPARAATFHMGQVDFPIDLLFAGADGVIRKIVHAALPGGQARWSHAATAAVIEVPGGFCVRNSVDIGQHVSVAGRRLSAQTYNLLRNITEADAPLIDSYYSKEPMPGTEVPHEDIPPEERFREHRLPDEAFPEAMDQPSDGYAEQFGYQPSEGLEDIVGPNVRMMARATERRSRVVRAQVRDMGRYVAGIVEAMARAQATGSWALEWQPDLLNAGATESAVVTQADVSRWLQTLGLDAETRQAAVREVGSVDGLQSLADGLVLAGLADVGRVMGHSIILFRGRGVAAAWR
jgi:uncharacterized membrane protein (UPF0127 family)